HGESETFRQRWKSEAQRILVKRRKIVVRDKAEHAHIRRNRIHLQRRKAFARCPRHENIQSEGIDFLGNGEQDIDVLVSRAAAEDKDERASIRVRRGMTRKVRLPTPDMLVTIGYNRDLVEAAEPEVVQHARRKVRDRDNPSGMSGEERPHDAVISL